MIYVSRFLCVLAVMVAVSLTPSGCSDAGETAMAFDEPAQEISEEAVRYSVVRGAAYDFGRTEEAESKENGS